MPAIQRGGTERLGRGKWCLRYRDNEGARHRVSPFPTKAAALDHYRTVIAPQLRGDEPAKPDLTLDEFCDLFLDRHAAVRSPRTVQGLRERLARPRAAYGTTRLSELERMAGDLADFRATLPERYAHTVMSALRQALAAAVRWDYLTRNPAVLAGENPQPPPRAVRAFTLRELDALDRELGERYGPLVPFAAATGLRPQEWAALERGDVDRVGAVVHVHRTRKTAGSVREVPLTPRALAALDRVPPRLDTRLLFTSPTGLRIDLDNFRRREWTDAVDASGVDKPARIYDLRSTFASNALHAGVTPFELAKIMGTSVRMLERHYGTLIAGAKAGIAARLAALEAEQEAEREVEAES
jgi:integrase